ncbi:hypothetical protein [Sessilibacter sp. MAH4]
MDFVNLVSQFRNALLVCIDADLHYMTNLRDFDDFPEGCCDLTSHLLGKFLIDNGVSGVYLKYVNLAEHIKRPNSFSDVFGHEWCCIGKHKGRRWHLDLTAHQFDFVTDEIIISSESNSWHEQLLSLVEDNQGEFGDRDPLLNIAGLSQFYDEILKVFYMQRST